MKTINYHYGSCLGCLLKGTAGLLVIGVIGLLAFGVDPRGYFTDSIPVWRDTQKVIETWARVPPPPKTHRNRKYEVTGTMFTRTLIISFEDDPEVIKAWIQSCPGISDPDCEIEVPEVGTITYRYPGGGGALGTLITHEIERGRVRIRAYWS